MLRLLTYHVSKIDKTLVINFNRYDRYNYSVDQRYLLNNLKS